MTDADDIAMRPLPNRGRRVVVPRENTDDITMGPLPTHGRRVVPPREEGPSSTPADTEDIAMAYLPNHGRRVVAPREEGPSSTPADTADIAMTYLANHGRRVVVPKEEEPSGTPDVADDETAVDDDSSDDDRTAVAAISEGHFDPVYEAKAMVINHAIQEIGMGWYQWQLFLVVGFGWASDNMWPMVTSLILLPIANEFAPSHPALLTLCQNVGLLAGAVFWGFGCDIMGRKTAFNYTLGLATIFGLSAAMCHNFASVGCMVAFWSFGVGGNLPVDSAIFLEFLPPSHQYLLTVLSVDWAFAQLFVNIISWPVLTKFSCEQHEGCLSGDNLGWRWLLMAVGGASLLMLFARFFLFTVNESPKYLVGVGLEEDAVAVIHEIARVNRRYTSLTLEDLKACEPDGYVDNDRASHVIHRRLLTVGVGRVRKLFGTKRLAFSTGLVMAIWSLIGLAYPLYNAFLPYIQATRGIEFGDGSNNITFRNSMIVAVLGVPGALMGAYLVERPHIGRKGTLALSTAMTGTFLYGSTSAKNSTSLLGWNCGFSLSGNIMNAVLYSFTPELFPTPQRGTGNALAAMCNRLFGIAAPVIAIYGNLETAIPVYTSGALFVVAGLLAMLLPFESQGRAAL